MGYAFISYSSKNQQMADSFRILFNRNGIETWMAPGDIPFGSTYTSTINRAIKDSSCFVLLLSENAQGSPWVLKETERAISTGKTIFTVLLDDVSMNDDFEFMLSTSQAVAIRKIDESDEKIKQLVVAIKAYSGEELQVEQKQKNVEAESNAYFEENAVMKGSVLERFKGRALTSVVIPEGVTVIGPRAFAFYPGLKGISIPSTVKRIDEYAFIKCPKLQSITVSPDNPVFRSVNNCCIERSTNKLIFGCGKSVIPEGTTIISKDAFNGCESLLKINIPSSIIRIEEDAFLECANLKELNFEEGIIEIGKLAFCDCYSLNEIRIPASATKIADGAFYKCKSLQSIQVSKQNPAYYSKNNCCIETKTQRLIIGCKNSIVPEGVTSIADMAFIGCDGLTEISLPVGVIEIGKDAFRDCENLSSIVLPNSIEKIKSAAFCGCESIRELFIPESVRVIEKGAFMGCAGICSIKVDPKNTTYRSEDDCCIINSDNILLFGCMNSIIPDGITEIADGAFCGCSALDYIHIPKSVVRIGCDAFSGCYELTDISLSEGVERIESNAFEQCALTSLIFPRSLRYIGEFSFFECFELTNLVIPDSVYYVGQLAFSGNRSGMDRREIFCEASKKPGRWHRDWTDEDSDIYWRDEWYYDEDGMPVVKDYENGKESDNCEEDSNGPRFLRLQCPNCNSIIYIEPEKDQRIDNNGIVHALCSECGQDVEIGRAYTYND